MKKGQNKKQLSYKGWKWKPKNNMRMCLGELESFEHKKNSSGLK